MRPLAALLSLAISLSALAQQTFDTRSVDQLMLKTMKAWQIPGAAIAIVKSDRVIYLQGYGTTELGGGNPVTPETLFQIASTSKAFTSTALAMLATDKKLTFDDPVREHLEYFRLADACADANVTLRDIVSHRTGLSRHDELWDDTPLTREDVVRSIGRVALSKPFRTTYQYQNIMFIAAGEVVTKTSGMAWDDFVRTRIFQPLNMTHTVTSDANWNTASHANGYRYDWKTDRVAPQRPIDTTTIGAGGAIKSCARDMANWVRFQLSGGSFDGKQLVDPEQLAETKTPQTVMRLEGLSRDTNPETQVMSYAMGWNVQDYRGDLLVSHAGALNGFRTHVDLLPKRNLGYVLMINVGRGFSLLALRNTLADMLTGKPSRDWNSYYLMIDRRSDEKDEKERLDRLAKRVSGTSPTHVLADYAGSYESPSYGDAKVTLVDGALMLQWNRLSLPLTHFHYDVFHAESAYHDVDEMVTFRLDDEKNITGLSLFGETFAKR